MDINELLDKELTLEVSEYGTLKITPREFLKKRNELSKCLDLVGIEFYEVLEIDNVTDICLRTADHLDILLGKKTLDVILLVIFRTHGLPNVISLPKTVVFGTESIEEYKMHALWYWKKKAKGNFGEKK